ncbi:hypothetical protein N2152v2_004222 [Parachlorella kessleri]
MLEDQAEPHDTMLQHASSRKGQPGPERPLTEQPGQALPRKPQHCEEGQSQQQQQQQPKRAWLLPPLQYAVLHQHQIDSEHPGGGDGAPPGSPDTSTCSQEWATDEWQFLHQTAGWPESWRHIQHILATQGPFDGILGFSQGAAVAAVLCALQDECQRCTALGQADQYKQEGAGAALGHPTAVAAASQHRCLCSAAPGSDVPVSAASPVDPKPEGAAALQPSAAPFAAAPGTRPAAKPATETAPGLPPPPWFKCAICCSGYISPVAEHRSWLDLARQRGGIDLPSLHLFGSGGGDRQVGAQESQQLAGCFAAAQASVVQHNMGHLIPTSKPIIEELRAFLAGFAPS